MNACEQRLHNGDGCGRHLFGLGRTCVIHGDQLDFGPTVLEECERHRRPFRMCVECGCRVPPGYGSSRCQNCAGPATRPRGVVPAAG